jgi:hypothetical protein
MYEDDGILHDYFNIRGIQVAPADLAEHQTETGI